MRDVEWLFYKLGVPLPIFQFQPYTQQREGERSKFNLCTNTSTMARLTPKHLRKHVHVGYAHAYFELSLVAAKWGKRHVGGCVGKPAPILVVR